eukprot:scaffold28881_cov71-Phaeocystis_antarctica.AAC.1
MPHRRAARCARAPRCPRRARRWWRCASETASACAHVDGRIIIAGVGGWWDGWIADQQSYAKMPSDATRQKSSTRLPMAWRTTWLGLGLGSRVESGLESGLGLGLGLGLPIWRGGAP